MIKKEILCIMHTSRYYDIQKIRRYQKLILRFDYSAGILLNPTTITSLWRHWLRSCWVSQFWQHSNHPDIFTQLPVPEESGWLLHCDKYTIDWESTEVQQSIRQQIEFLTKGCNCKKGCRTLRCGCRKRSRNCGPGCLCQGCSNVTISESLPHNGGSSNSSSDEESAKSDEEQPLEEEIITEDDFYFTTYDIL